MFLRYDQGMNTHHEALTPSHPAVEAAAREFYVHDAPSHDPQTWPPTPDALADDYRGAAIAALAAALPHLTADDARPWEPLNGRPVRVGDEVRQDWYGTTTTAIVGRVDGDGDPWTAEGGLIGLLHNGTWYVRRTVQELPTEDGAVIVANDGHARIEAVTGGVTYHAREASLRPLGRWHAVWRTATGERVCYSVRPEEITPGTWKVDDQ